MTARVLFLDIDGVMNTLSTPVDPALGLTSLLLPRCVAALDRIVRATGAVVVVTSTWRLTMPLTELRAHFAAAGSSAEIVDITPDLDAPRRDAIRVRSGAANATNGARRLWWWRQAPPCSRCISRSLNGAKRGGNFPSGCSK